MPEPVDRNEATKMLAWTLDVVVFPLIFGLGYWVWGTEQIIVALRADYANYKQQMASDHQAVVSRMDSIYQDGTKALKEMLILRAGDTQQMIYVQRKIDENCAKLETMNTKLTDMLLMQRDLLNEIKSNQRANYPHEGP